VLATKVLPSNASYKGTLDFTLTPEDLSAIDAEHRR